MVDWKSYRITPLDLAGNFEEGYIGGKKKVAGRLAGMGNYADAASTVMPYDAAAATGYLKLRDYEDDRAYGREAGEAILAGNYTDAAAAAARRGKVSDALTLQKTGKEQTTQAYAAQIGQGYAALQSIKKAPPAQRQQRFDALLAFGKKAMQDAGQDPAIFDQFAGEATDDRVNALEQLFRVAGQQAGMEFPKAEGFDLAPGARRYDASGKEIAYNPKTYAPSRAAGGGSSGEEGEILGPDEAEAAGYPRGTWFIKPGAAPKRLDKDPPKSTEGENLAAGFAVRMDGAYGTIERLAREGKVDWAMVYAPDEVAAAANPATKEARRAVRDFINAQLRRESGAAIGKDEFASARLQYIPAPGDPPQVVAAKLRAMQQARDILRKQGGTAYERLATVEQPGAGSSVYPPMPTKASGQRPVVGQTYTMPDGGLGTWDGRIYRPGGQ